MSDPSAGLVYQASAVAIEGRALLIEGHPGSGKSSLALALIDRGAALIGDDGVTLEASGIGVAQHLIASPPPNTAGMIEVHGVGIANLSPVARIPVALILDLGSTATRLPEEPRWRAIMGVRIPILAFDPGTIAGPERARMALRLHGLETAQN